MAWDQLLFSALRLLPEYYQSAHSIFCVASFQTQRLAAPFSAQSLTNKAASRKPYTGREDSFAVGRDLISPHQAPVSGPEKDRSLRSVSSFIRKPLSVEIASGDEGCLPNHLSQNVNTMTQLLLLSLTQYSARLDAQDLLQAKRLPLHRSGLAPRPHPPGAVKEEGGSLGTRLSRLVIFAGEGVWP